MISQELVLYRNLKYQELFDEISLLLAVGPDDKPETMPDPFACAGRLIELSVAYGFEGNLWHCFLTLCLVDHENAYSMACEIAGFPEGSLRTLAVHDFALFRDLFACDIRNLDGNGSAKGNGVFDILSDYRASGCLSRVFNKRIRDQIVSLATELSKAESTAGFQASVTEFYRRFGTGRLGLFKAFRVEELPHDARIMPIGNVECVRLSDIVGYETQKMKLVENTEAFLQGREANNVLLFGDSGTGKSSCIKAILNEYYGRGLRMIEVYKHQFKSLTRIQEQIKDRNYRFIIYMDDLSFEDFELEYKYLKAIIEGGLGKKPGNVLIYATSNRRHLIRERFSDKRESEDELHQNDTVQEKLSLVARFGVTIYFGAPDKSQFQQIVEALAKRSEINLPPECLFAEAGKWELSHGGRSGRTASQFITHLTGTKKDVT